MHAIAVWQRYEELGVGVMDKVSDTVPGGYHNAFLRLALLLMSLIRGCLA